MRVRSILLLQMQSGRSRKSVFDCTAESVFDCVPETVMDVSSAFKRGTTDRPRPFKTEHLLLVNIRKIQRRGERLDGGVKRGSPRG